MSEIGGGGMSFKATLNNEQLNRAIEETLRRIQGLSDGTVASGKAMDRAFAVTAVQVRNAIGGISKTIEGHEQELGRLKSKYEELGRRGAKAFNRGRDDEYRAMIQQQVIIQGEITARQHLIKELQDQTNWYEEAASKIEVHERKVKENADAQTSMRTRIRELREEMMMLVDQGIDEQSEAYQRLKNELGRLTDIQADVNQQARILANDEAKFQGIISGLSGLAGGFSAVTGAISLFAGENEDLQKVMAKVQSVMAITIGMQQVSQALNKDSAFRLVTINNLKKWWANIVKQATAAEVAETTAITGNTAAQGTNTAATGGQAVAAKTGTAANLTLAGAFRAVGLAIKSIPVFGWIVAGISLIIAAVTIFSSKAREAKKAQEEFSKAMIDGCYKPIGTIQELSAKYSALGDNLEAKKKFIEQNRKSFEELGVSVNDVTDAENVLINNKGAFIAAQIAKAKSMVYSQQAMEETKKLIAAQEKLASVPKAYDRRKGEYTDGYGVKRKGMITVKDSRWQKAEDAVKESQSKIDNLLEKARKAEEEGFEILTSAGIEGANTYREGAVGAIEQAIQAKQAALKLLTNRKEYEKGLNEIKDLEKQLEKITGKSAKGGGSGSDKDPFVDKLEQRKKEYNRFMQWINSGDEELAKNANKEFEGLLKEGATYINYLKRQREQLLAIGEGERSKLQNKQLEVLNNKIAEESNGAVLDAFNKGLDEQIGKAKTVLEVLDIIEQKRKELANDGTDLDKSKKEALDKAESSAIAKQKQETERLLEEYASYLDKKIKLDQEYNNDLALLERQRSEAKTEEERTKVERVIEKRTQQYEKESKNTGDEEYDAMVEQYADFEQRKQAIIDEYEAKRKVAREHSNEEMIDKLNEAQAKAISALASEELTNSEVWANLFGNLDELTASQISTLVEEIESKFESLSGVFNPIDLAAVRDKLNEAKAVLMQDNPFKQVAESLRAIFSEAGDDSKASADKIKKHWKRLAESTSKSFDFVSNAVNSADFLKDAIGNIGATAIASMTTVAGVAIAVSTAIKTAEKSSVILAIIQAALVVVQAVVNVIKSIAGNKDKEISRNIEQHAAAVDRLKSAYTELSWAIDKALGGDVYKKQQAAIENMEAQREHLRKMQEAEESKKKSDSGKVNEYKDQYDQLGRDIEDMLDKIAEDLLQTNAKSFADELGDALVEAFGKGEDAAKAFEETTNKIIKQAILNQLKKEFLENQLRAALDKLKKAMGYKEGENFVFDGLTAEEIEAFKAEVAAIAGQFNEAMKAYSEIFKDILDESDTSLTGAVKGVSEETASIVAGQMNAIRINQLEAAETLRQQLFFLANIDRNTVAIDVNTRYIRGIYEKMNSGDPLRGRGLF